jgi:hypothetical protein
MDSCENADSCPDRRKFDHWRINKTVDLTLIISILSGMAIMGIYVANQATRQSLTEQAIVYITGDQRRQDEEMKGLRYEIKESLSGLDAKITRLLETKK